MCRDEIGRVQAVDRATGSATVDVAGVTKDISLLALDDGTALRAGDWVSAYQGYALTILDEPTAQELVRERVNATNQREQEEP